METAKIEALRELLGNLDYYQKEIDTERKTMRKGFLQWDSFLYEAEAARKACNPESEESLLALAKAEIIRDHVSTFHGATWGMDINNLTGSAQNIEDYKAHIAEVGKALAEYSPAEIAFVRCQMAEEALVGACADVQCGADPAMLTEFTAAMTTACQKYKEITGEDYIPVRQDHPNETDVEEMIIDWHCGRDDR